jgi:alanine racemase
MSLSDQPYLVIASDEIAEQVFDGRYSAEIVESPEPDLERVREELERVASRVGEYVKICVTFKSQFCRPSLDLYARVLAGAPKQVTYAAVAAVEDAIQLRLFGAKQRLALLYVQDPALVPLFERFNLEPAAASGWWLHELRRRTTRPVSLHLWVDTGLGREGLLPGEAVQLANEMQGAELAALATHFAAVPYRYSDGSLDKDPPRLSMEFTKLQQQQFEDVRKVISERRSDRFCCHVATSGPIQHGFDWTYYDMVRPGRVVVEYFLRARPRRTLAIHTTVRRAQVAQVKHLPAGWSLGYVGSTHHTTPATVATLTTSTGTNLRSGPISLLKGGVRHTLPLLIAHTGMCVVRADGVPIEPGDIVDLNHPAGMQREFLVPLDRAFDGAIHDPIRQRTLVLSRWRDLVLRLRPANRLLVESARRPRYWGSLPTYQSRRDSI